MTNWLRRDIPATKADTSQLRGLLAQIESVFSSTAESRRTIDKTLGTADSPPRTAALNNLKDATNQQIAALRQQIAQAFGAAKQAAQANRVKAGKDFHASAEGAQYLQALTAFAALAPHLDAVGLAARIDTALDNGLTAHARAWAEIARLNPPTNPDGALYLALDRAEAEALTPAELSATLDAEYLDQSERRFNLYANAQTKDRLAFALDQGDATHADGNFGPGRILDGEPAGQQFSSAAATDGGE